MPIKIFAAVVATVLLLGFLTAIAVKMKDIALGTIMLIAVVMMLVDLWHSLTEKD